MRHPEALDHKAPEKQIYLITVDYLSSVFFVVPPLSLSCMRLACSPYVVAVPSLH
jgi:hypothetical protein